MLTDILAIIIFFLIISGIVQTLLLFEDYNYGNNITKSLNIITFILIIGSLYWLYSTDPEYTHSDTYIIRTEIFPNGEQKQYILQNNNRIYVTKKLGVFADTSKYQIVIPKYNYNVNGLELPYIEDEYSLRLKNEE